MDDAQETLSQQTAAIRAVFHDPEVSADRIALADQQAVYEPTEPAEHIYYVVRGQVRLYQTGPQGAGRLLSILGPGDWFGVVALARASRAQHRAVAVTQSVLLRAHADRFLEALARHPLAAIQLSRNLAQKVVTAFEDAAGLVFDDVTQRLVKTLLRFSTSPAAQRVPSGVVLRVTHEQLAQAIGVARETVSVTLTQLRHQKLISTGRNQLRFDPAILAEFVRGQKSADPCLEVN
jgi:CRP/FNR family transcriptional regulator, cyclic AMP receptor protein